MSRDLIWVQDILNAARLAQEGVRGFDKETLQKNWIQLSAVVRQIEIIGEAARRLSQEFRQNHPDIPWKSMVGMRDVLIHAYAELEIDDIWDTAHATFQS